MKKNGRKKNCMIVIIRIMKTAKHLKRETHKWKNKVTKSKEWKKQKLCDRFHGLYNKQRFLNINTDDHHWQEIHRRTNSKQNFIRQKNNENKSNKKNTIESLSILSCFYLPLFEIESHFVCFEINKFQFRQEFLCPIHHFFLGSI